uniref:Secreted protein n=1 Tax=Chlamydomonas euryale TaxID=1486919 RepID=A0A7R9V6M1_9CHLO
MPPFILGCFALAFVIELCRGCVGYGKHLLRVQRPTWPCPGMPGVDSVLAARGCRVGERLGVAASVLTHARMRPVFPRHPTMCMSGSAHANRSLRAKQRACQAARMPIALASEAPRTQVAVCTPVAAQRACRSQCTCQ